MTKLIAVTSIRAGTGKTTITSILAEKLCKVGTVLIIDNNKSNINIYNIKTSSIDDIKLYLCLENKETCKKAIKESATEIKDNIYFFSGSHELLTEKELKCLKEQNIYDYIIVDTDEIYNEFYDFSIMIINPNVHEYIEFHKLKLENSILIVNKFINDIEFKISKEYFKLYFCSEIINFTNGYELVLPEENKWEIEMLLLKITGEVFKNEKIKFRLFKRR